MIKLTSILPEDYEYRGSHTAPDKSHNAPLNDLTDTYPDDIYSANGARYYGDGSSTSLDNKAINIIKSNRGTPDALISVYRAVPKESSDSVEMKIHPGDWVTTTREYAVRHGQSVLNGKYRILTKLVKASQLYSDGNSIHEWGYDPS